MFFVGEGVGDIGIYRCFREIFMFLILSFYFSLDDIGFSLDFVFEGKFLVFFNLVFWGYKLGDLRFSFFLGILIREI